MKGGLPLLQTFKKRLKLLDVIADKQVQVFKVNTNEPLGTTAEALLDPVLSVTFDRVVLFDDKVVVQGIINKNIIIKELNSGKILHLSVPVEFSKAVDLPGLNTTVTIGRGNRAVIVNNVVEIGPDNDGSNAGFDVQIYVERLVSKEILINNNTAVDEKIILDFILKISKFKQIDLKIPAPARIFEFTNVIDC
jgi:hypothetical protein